MMITIPMDYEALKTVEREIEESRDSLSLIIFKDKYGKMYVLTHGRETKRKKGILAYIKYKLYPATLQAWRTTSDLRRTLIDKGIPSNEEINLICCYGGMIRNTDKHTTIVNDTNKPVYTHASYGVWHSAELIVKNAE